MYGSWDMKFNRQNAFIIVGNFITRVGCTSFFHFGQFLALLPLLTAQKIKISRKWRRHLDVSSFNTSLPKILLLCYIAPEIWKVADVIIFYVGLFLPLYPPNNLKESCSNWYHFTQVYIPKIMIVCYTISEIWYMIAVIIFYFGLFFALLLSNKPKKSNFQKSEKNCPDISSFYTCAPKVMIRWCTVSSPPKKINISKRVQLSLRWKIKRNCKPNSIIQTFVYRSNIYYSKTDQSGHWKSNSSTLHLD